METYGEAQLPPSPPLLCTLSKQWNDVEGFGLTILYTSAGFSIAVVKPGSPADRVGLRIGQMIIEINGDNVETESKGQVSTRIRESGSRLQMLVAGPDTYEYYKDKGVAIYSTMPDIQMVVTPHKPYRLRNIAEFIAKKVNTYLAGRKYLAEVALRLPLMFFIHFLFILGPSSDYTIVELVMCLIRYACAFFLFGTWGLGVEKMIILYSSVACNFFITWLSNSVYWTFHSEALGVCSDVWLPWEQDTWWTPILLTLILQIAYLVYLIESFQVPREVFAVLAVLMLPYLLCSCGFFLFLPVQYWVSKFIFCSCFLVHLFLSFDDALYDDKNGNFQMPPLPGPCFFRDVLAMFGVIYYTCCAVFDLTFTYSASYVFSLSYLSTAIGMWCTSFAVVVGLGAIFAFASNAAAAACMKLIKGESNFVAIMNSHLGNRVNVTMTTYCIEAGILSASTETRVVTMESVLFLTTYVIFLQAWDQTEAELLQVVNSGAGNRAFNFLRVFLFSVFLLTTTTAMTLHVAPLVSVDTWLLMNLSGNVLLLVRAVTVFVEMALVACAWHADGRLDLLEDIIYYARVTKTIATVLVGVISAYYRFYAPFFDTWWVIRALVIVADISIVVLGAGKREWVIFKARQMLINKYAGLPDATAQELQENDDVCSICYGAMVSAKKLPCSHVFHATCLRKWFQVKTVCPYCNANVFNTTQS